ncbi:helix-turn-helix domain-containing protein [Flavitalea sp. BT771]|uniref:helix-turn-helix domain-containing protein n=1 Tax=Flavitalea sp. BT771 TaxID=3063329 RepID=UPI0026E17FA8|nr:helix-turn-helix domain-containing protein [Flavitalea sp. BT771]MDO6429028.1 helix-turn-helix domain-containing protein [Flavitalea sp. BT771]MDV6218844.1 helix-turn-helix domain-containing protein [Flavitalea sp. BT771]
MIDIITLEKAKKLSKPRRIMKYVLIYCSSGKLSIAVDEKELLLKGGEVITITSGQIHCIEKAVKAKGYILEFTLDFFCKNDHDIELLFHNGLFCHFSMNEVIAINRSNIENQLNGIAEELAKRPYQFLISIHSRIELILVEINRAKVQRGDEIWKPDALFLKFLDAVRNNFERNYSLSQFARLLGTTEIKLNELAKLHAGKTAQNVIYGLITSEAKRLLTYGDLSVKEVAYQLGFKDPFYFSNFFKKHSKLSPKLYKEKAAM